MLIAYGNVSIAGGMCLLLVDGGFSLCNRFIACGMCLLLVECVYCLVFFLRCLMLA